MQSQNQQPQEFEVKPLPYSVDALSPYISAATLEFHHGKHYRTYVENLNRLLKDNSLATLSLEEIICNSDGAIFNNAAQSWNHEFYFEQLSPTPQVEPSGELKEAITKSFGSLENLKEEMTKSAVSLFGSGWVWLAQNMDGSLLIMNKENADNPITQGIHPLLTIDVWEHAYYLDHQNRRADSVVSFWDVVDWTVIEKRMQR